MNKDILPSAVTLALGMQKNCIWDVVLPKDMTIDDARNIEPWKKVATTPNPYGTFRAMDRLTLVTFDRTAVADAILLDWGEWGFKLGISKTYDTTPSKALLRIADAEVRPSGAGFAVFGVHDNRKLTPEVDYEELAERELKRLHSQKVA